MTVNKKAGRQQTEPGLKSMLINDFTVRLPDMPGVQPAVLEVSLDVL